MEKFFQVLRRFVKVLWLVITVPLLLYFIISRIPEELKGDFGYFYSPDKETEITYIYRYSYLYDYCSKFSYSYNKKSNVECNKVKLMSEEDYFASIKNEDTTKKFLNGEISSREALGQIGHYTSNYQFHHTSKSIAYSILQGIVLILLYIIGTDLLIKTGGYIWNGKFAGGINYKKLLNLK